MNDAELLADIRHWDIRRALLIAEGQRECATCRHDIEQHHAYGCSADDACPEFQSAEQAACS